MKVRWFAALAGVCALVMVVACGSTEPTDVGVVAQASISVEQDGCLDHTVRELGMSASQRAGERAWDIGPQFVHPSIVPDGAVKVRIEKDETLSTVVVKVAWPGDRKPPEVQTEIESRVMAMAHKMVQACGIPQPEVRCVTTAAGRERACAATRG